METKPFTSGLSENAVLITRVADRQWHALDDDLVVGRGHALHRPDGRLVAHALGTLHRSGSAAAWTEVHESKQAASALFEGIGARPMSSNLELVR